MKRSPFWSRAWSGKWWWGSVCLALIATVLPYWTWNYAAGARDLAALWRFPAAPNAVFDSYLYFQQLSLLKIGINTGTFDWFAWPLSALMRLLPQAAIPEIWFLSRWVTTFLLFWVGAWSIWRLSGVEKTVAKWLILSYWLSFPLVIGLRPGMSSWYLPFAFLGLAGIAQAANSLYEGRWVRAGLIVLGSLFLLKIYPWYFIFGAVLAASVFLAHLISKSRQKMLYGLAGLFALGVCGYAIALVAGILDFRMPATLAQYDRNGINFAHMPLISNTVLAMGVWLVLLFVSRARLGAMKDKYVFLAWSWIVCLVVWLSTPIIGVDILNDHFIIITSILSWVTLGMIIAAPPDKERLRRWERFAALAIACFASAFLLYILQKALKNVGKFEPYAIHLSNWGALALAAWFQWFGARGQDVALRWKRLRYPVMAVSTAFGALGLWAVIERNKVDMPRILSRLPVISWIQKHVPPDEAVCTDPANAKILAAHAERTVYPSDANLMLFESDEAQHKRLIAILSAFDDEAAKQTVLYPYLINGVRTLSCAQYANEAAWLERVFGMSKAEAQRFVGCQEERGAAFERAVMSAIRARQVDAKAFSSYCPWLVVPDEQKTHWVIPGGYEEIRATQDTSVWHWKSNL